MKILAWIIIGFVALGFVSMLALMAMETILQLSYRHGWMIAICIPVSIVTIAAAFIWAVWRVTDD